MFVFQAASIFVCTHSIMEVWPCSGGRKEGRVRKGNKSFIPYPSVHAGHSFVADCLHEMRQNQNSLGWFGLLVRSKAVGDAKDQRIFAYHHFGSLNCGPHKLWHPPKG